VPGLGDVIGGFAGAAVGGALPSDGGVTDEGPPSQSIPVSVAWSPTTTKVIVNLSIGGGTAIPATIDTGSVGIRVLSSAVPPSAWQPSSTPLPVYVYGGAVRVHGVAATARVALGGVELPAPIVVEDVTSRDCTDSRPDCDASSPTFGNGYAAIVGLGMRAAGPLASPLVSLAKTGRYIVALPPVNGVSGTLIVDPPPDVVARFGQAIQLGPFDGAEPTTGARAWDDRTVPFCLNHLCSVGLLDTGGNRGNIAVSASSDYVALGVPDGSSTFPAGIHVTETIGERASWSFEVQTVAVSGVDLFALGSGTSLGNNLGPAPYFVNDVLYDYTNGQIAVAPKK
jgi:hypothetical protein